MSETKFDEALTKARHEVGWAMKPMNAYHSISPDAVMRHLTTMSAAHAEVVAERDETLARCIKQSERATTGLQQQVGYWCGNCNGWERVFRKVTAERDVALRAVQELAEHLYARMKDVGSIDDDDNPEAFVRQALDNAAKEATDETGTE